MAMTMSQKILAKKAGLDHVEPGQLINADVDLVLGNDITTPVAIDELEKCGFEHVFSKTGIAIVLDTSFRIRISRRRSFQNAAATLPRSMGLSIFTMWAGWASSTRCCRNRGLSRPEN